MSPAIEPKTDSLELGVELQRAALSLLEENLSRLSEVTQAPVEHVHAVRRHNKRLVALFDLLPSPCQLKLEPRLLRTSSWFLEHSRRMDVLQRVLQRLEQSMDAECGEVRKALEVEAARTRARVLDPANIEDAGQLIRIVQRRVGSWRELSVNLAQLFVELDKGREEASRTYRKARQKPTSKRLHAWRKAVKRYQDQLAWLVRFQDVPPDRQKALDKLSDVLGDEHDLHDFKQWLRLLSGQGVDSGTARKQGKGKLISELEQVTSAIKERRGKLRKRALRLGRELFRSRRCLLD